MSAQCIDQRRRSMAAAVLATPLWAGAGRAIAQPRGVTLIVPYVPGGAVDTFARLFATVYSEQTGSTVVVENHGGASGAIGLARAANAPADGRTLLYTYGNLALGMLHTVKDSPNILVDLTPVARSVVTQGVLATGVGSRLRSFADVLAQAAKAPGSISFADYGELTMSRLMVAAKIELLRVPYKGGSPGIVDTITGQVDLYAGSAASLVPQIQAGKLRALAITSPRRMPQLPDVPTVSETLPNYTALNYQGVFAPKNTPQNVLDTLQRQVLAAIDKPSFRKAAEDRFANVEPMGATEFRHFMSNDEVEIARVVKATAPPR